MKIIVTLEFDGEEKGMAKGIERSVRDAVRAKLGYFPDLIESREEEE